ncbi:conserved hypothetical ATP-binding domain-containing protein, putative [Eimeria maxima]|uniref:GPN-loop GTPase 2 n=1 Tax=Eimeria maxima TaxID=5804 RepID=U6M407_EIMMA|nr:conserved hypothetical ATP-binding domain-containing protein, putative [Eimeria maxima]CDJ57159.1 conserved hypothetical ATP-binding domain-containing protein, putative [Eimeria maxima]
MWYGQIVIGPPGSGKSSYCFGMQQLLTALERQHIIVNLDPMNDLLPYECAVDVMDLIKGTDVMKKHQLGPNGAMIYCMEFLLENVDWLVEKLKKYKNYYVLIDCPGQVELFTHHEALRTIIRHLEKLDFRMAAVQVLDSTLCTDTFKVRSHSSSSSNNNISSSSIILASSSSRYDKCAQLARSGSELPFTVLLFLVMLLFLLQHISALLMALYAQLQLELPHINVLSKIDLLRHHRKDLKFPLEFYADAYDVQALLQTMGRDPHPVGQKLLGFAREVCELVEDFNIVSFLPVAVTDKECMLLALRTADTANGFALGNYTENRTGYPLQLNTEEERQNLIERLQERYLDGDEEDERDGNFRQDSEKTD